MAAVERDNLTSGKEFTECLQRLGYSDNERTESFDWLMEIEVTAPFISWLCKNFNEDNILKSQEVEEYEQLLKSGDGVLDGILLDEGLNSMTNQQDITQEILSEKVTILKEEIQDIVTYKEKLFQHRNLLSMQCTLSSFQLSKLNGVEALAYKNFKKKIEQNHNQNSQLNSELAKLAATVTNLNETYCKSALFKKDWNQEQDFHDQNSQQLFISQLSLSSYHKAEENFTQQLTQYSKKQFFQGIADITGHKEAASRYELLDISNPLNLLISGEKEHRILEDCKELARLKFIYAASESQYISMLSHHREIEAIRMCMDHLLQHLRNNLFPTEKKVLSKRLQQSRLLLEGVQSDNGVLVDIQLPKLLEENSELQTTKVLSGDFNLKIMRQEYFQSKLDQVMKQLVAQKARVDLLTMMYEVECQRHHDTHRLLATTVNHLEIIQRFFQSRMVMMEHSALTPSQSLRETVDSRDQFLLRLHHITDIKDVNKRSPLFVTYSSLSSSLKALCHELYTHQNNIKSYTSDIGGNLHLLENCVKVYEDLIVPGEIGAAVPIFTPVLLTETMKHLDQTLKSLELSIMDIISDIKKKKQDLKNDPLLAEDHNLYVYFLADPPKLRQALTGLNQKLQAQLVK